ncbi:protein of unknown function [Mucilaginibacter pineti]|uniref:DUF1772 domain-containing protein n=1 Tax=Mucilaginibacter pineti TaxID=1391627 RepID=A0A1G6X427_9SPHI|nr:anthrone oxygenase family protein [Mucilaginibacter pineti]SDD72065.1 protein of unknown function [Mucilaginibacter pineti]
MIAILEFVAIFLLMLVTGVFWGPWFALSRSLSAFSAGEFIKIAKIMSANLGAPMRFLLPLCIIAMLLTVWFYPQKSAIGFYAGIMAVALIIISLIITIAIEVPIVKGVEEWTVETIPTNWTAIRDRWIKFHVVRTLTSLCSFACFVVAILY